MGSERDAGERDRSAAQLIADQRRALIRLAGMLLLEQNDEWLVHAATSPTTPCDNYSRR
jgi:hypothetical protein